MTNPTPDDALLPCAHCGASDAHNQSDYSDENCVVCAVCDARGPMKRTYAEAIAAWNLRAGQSHDAGLLAALEECVTVLTAETIGTIYEDDPAWYAAIDRAVPRARAAIAAAKGEKA